MILFQLHSRSLIFKKTCHTQFMQRPDLDSSWRSPLHLIFLSSCFLSASMDYQTCKEAKMLQNVQERIKMTTHRQHWAVVRYSDHMEGSHSPGTSSYLNDWTGWCQRHDCCIPLMGVPNLHRPATACLGLRTKTTWLGLEEELGLG